MRLTASAFLSAWLIMAAQADPEAVLLERLRATPDSFELNHQLGELYAKAGKVSAAVPYLEKAHKIKPEDATNAYDLGLAYLKSGQIDKARVHVQTLLERTEKAELQNLLGAIEEQSGDPVAATKRYQRAAELDPSEGNVFDFANALLRYNAVDASLRIFDYGAGRYPKSAKLRVGLGIAQYVSGEYDKSILTLCEAVDLDPKDTRALLFLGKLHDVNPQMAGEVSKRLQGFAHRYPQNAAASYYYAVSLWKSSKEAPEKRAEVETLLKRAIALDDNLAGAHFQLGWMQENSGRLDDAVREYQRSLELDASSDAAHFRLAQVLIRLGRKQEATKHLQLFQEIRQKQEAAASRAEKERVGLVVK